MNLENIMPDERGKAQKNIHCMLFVTNVQSKKNHRDRSQISGCTGAENKDNLD